MEASPTVDDDKSKAIDLPRENVEVPKALDANGADVSVERGFVTLEEVEVGGIVDTVKLAADVAPEELDANKLLVGGSLEELSAAGEDLPKLPQLPTEADEHEILPNTEPVNSDSLNALENDEKPILPNAELLELGSLNELEPNAFTWGGPLV